MVRRLNLDHYTLIPPMRYHSEMSCFLRLKSLPPSLTDRWLDGAISTATEYTEAPSIGNHNDESLVEGPKTRHGHFMVDDSFFSACIERELRNQWCPVEIRSQEDAATPWDAEILIRTTDHHGPEKTIFHFVVRDPT